MPVRGLPRAFVPGLEDYSGVIELPAEELKKFRNVLRLGSGDKVAILPGDGRLVVGVLDGLVVRGEEEIWPQTEPKRKLTLVLGQPRTEKLEEAVRMGTEIGVSEFWIFQAERSVVRWDDKKWGKHLGRLEKIAVEAAEVSYRTVLPGIKVVGGGLKGVLELAPEAMVLSEVEGEARFDFGGLGDEVVLVVGPEGGWAPREVKLIGDRAVSLGDRVLRVDTAVAVGCGLVLAGQ